MPAVRTVTMLPGVVPPARHAAVTGNLGIGLGGHVGDAVLAHSPTVLPPGDGGRQHGDRDQDQQRPHPDPSRSGEVRPGEGGQRCPQRLVRRAAAHLGSRR
jgi:hypothetical protein